MSEFIIENLSDREMDNAITLLRVRVGEALARMLDQKFTSDTEAPRGIIQCPIPK